jgi:putative PIG3 family NAD(P)H quinone oxidoreductase
MRAVRIREPGGVDVLALAQVPDLEPPPGHARVRVRYAGVNRADLLQRMGLYPAPKGAPADIPGLELSGVVDRVGADVTEIAVGDRVFALTGGGAYAEQVVLHERELVKIPSNVDDRDAAAVPEAFVTALDALVTRGRLVPGERVLVQAVGSGVGTAGVQIARALGCHTIGTSRTPDKLERAKALGLDVGVVAQGGAGEIGAALTAACPEGVDVVLELVGGHYVEADVIACAPKGRIVVVGLTGGASSDLALGALLRKRLEIVGTVLRSRPLEEKILAAGLLRTTIAPWLARGVVKAVVDRVFPLDEAGAAHAYVATNESFGKVLLEVG